MSMMHHQSLLETYLRQLRLPTFAHNYAAFAQDAARTGLSCERYLFALSEAEISQRDANRVERSIAQAKLPVLKELSQFDWSCVQGVTKTRVLELAQGATSRTLNRFSGLGIPDSASHTWRRDWP
jgi:DNA replication protein DnaC